jgi:hypothetical protein
MTRPLMLCAAALVAFALSDRPALGSPFPIARNSGAAMCTALAPDDFASVGVKGAAKPLANVSDPTGAYCVYAGKSSSTGGIEFDVFYPAGSTPADLKSTIDTMLGESGGTTGLGGYKKIPMTGADEAYLGTALVSGGPPFANIVVRRGDLAFDIGIPANPQSRDQLLKLAAIVLKRF